MKQTALVTGGAGFIGSHVADELIALGWEVVVLDDLSGGCLANVPEHAVFVEGSIVDADLVNALFKQYQFDYVYHFAAYAAEGLSHFIRRFNYENNLIGSTNLINAAVNFKVKCFVFTSSIAVYGENELPHHENQHPNPEDPYGIAKYAVEMDLKVAHKLFGLNSIIFRPHNVYGVRQNINDTYRNVIGIFMKQLLQGQPLTIFGDGKQTRAFTAITDVAPYIAKAVLNEKALNKIFNIGSDTPYTVLELAEKITQFSNESAPIQHLNARQEAVHAYAQHKQFNLIFQPKAFTPLDVGLKEMWEWAKSTPIEAVQFFKAIEIEQGLPQGWKG
jgi:UDP-glucose 4-epimerase